MANISTDIAELLQRHNIDLLRMEAGQRRDVVAMMKGLGSDVVDKVKRFDPTSYVSVRSRKKHLSMLVGAANEKIELAYKELAETTGQDLETIAKLEAGAAAEAINDVMKVELVSGRLSKHLLTQLAGNTLIDGAPSKEWWGTQSKDLQSAFKREMREGVINGETIQDLVRRVRGRREHGFKDGLISYNGSASRRAQALVRSSVMATANAARNEVYEQNADVVKGVQVLATLDARTTDVCKALDGQAWTLPEHNRLPGTELGWRGPPPFHWNCRSVLIPVMRSWADLATDPATKKKLEKIKPNIPGYRASMNGKVSNKIDYEGWLKTQSEAFQLEVLGPRKHKLWKAGKLPFTKLVDQSHRPLTVAELEKKTARKK